MINHLNNPICKAYENLSPATELYLPVATDDEGWPEYGRFAVGDVVLSPAGRAYRVQGFTLNNHLIVTEHGLDRTPAVVSMEIGTEGLTFPAVEYTVRHAAGLVEFA